MRFELQAATSVDSPVLENLMQLYLYDLSVFSGDTLNRQGEYFYHYLDLYWSETARHAFLINVKGIPVGFALVADYVVSQNADISIAEFFVMKAYRRKYIGQQVAHSLFTKFRGTWEIRAIADNKPAIRFWNRVIRDYTNGSFTYLQDGISPWNGPLWTFCNAK